ncbi:MAG: hypothetical protein JW837_14965 [Sedimentisphaerales bacterium]|nr:hypothetical protein [Sedimentisphaerales bacterium]
MTQAREDAAYPNPGGYCNKQDDQWKLVSNASDYGTRKDKFNNVKFIPVQTTSLRIEAKLQPNFSAGILEWRIDTD